MPMLTLKQLLKQLCDMERANFARSVRHPKYHVRCRAAGRAQAYAIARRLLLRTHEARRLGVAGDGCGDGSPSAGMTAAVGTDGGPQLGERGDTPCK